MNNSPNIKQVETVLKYIKNELYSGRLQPGERLPACLLYTSPSPRD